MPYTCVTFVYRKEGSTPQEFRDAWEKHVRFLLDITKPHSPIESVRHYPVRTDSDIAQRAPATVSRYHNAPLVLLGDTELVNWDAMEIDTYRDELHFNQFWTLVQDEKIGDQIAAAEAAVSEPSKLKLVVIGETVVTKEEGN